MNLGVLYVLSAYLMWGLLPIYWKALQSASATEILCHRMAWSFIFSAGLLLIRKNWVWIKRAIRSKQTNVLFITAGLLAVNWLTYIWSVNSGHLVEASLGYFISPLVHVSLGVLFIKERLRFWQWIAIITAAIGVLYLTVEYGAFPWIALTLALTFGFYGLVRKTIYLESLEGLGVEMAILFIPATGYLLYLEHLGVGSFGHGIAKSLLLAGAGVVTALPLIFFTAGARKINLATVGILQYIAPTCQFLLGVLVYGESFTSSRFIGFIIIWISLIIYATEGIMAFNKRHIAG